MRKYFNILSFFALAVSLSALVISCQKDEIAVIPVEEEQEESVSETQDEPEEPIETPPEIPVLGTNFVRDYSNSLIVYNGDDVDFGDQVVFDGDTLELETTDTSLLLGKSYTGFLRDTAISIVRTELPIIAINYEGSGIPDEPKIASTFTLFEKGKQPFESDLGIEVRGGLSQSFPKQSFSIELWADPEESDNVDAPLLGMRDDDDWILDGMWNEPLHLRDYTAQELWLRMGRYPYSEEEQITFGIKREYCELFINNEYRGPYYLSEKIDRKQLQLKKYDDDLQQVRGELFKGSSWANGTLVTGVDPFNNSSLIWSGYEAKYPDDIGELDWSNIHTFTDFVVNSDQTEFDATISERLDFENMADYFIFLNVTYAHDNWGKNVYAARYDADSPYFFVPWDLDATFGNTWTGERINITNGILVGDEFTENGLYKRMLLNPEFQAELKSRWNNLRGNVLATAELQQMFDESYNILNGNQVYAREALNDEFPFNYSDQEIDFIKTWIAQRMTYLDGYFSSL